MFEDVLGFGVLGFMVSGLDLGLSASDLSGVPSGLHKGSMGGLGKDEGGVGQYTI